MEFIRTELPGVIIIEPDVYKDKRGFFLETHHQIKYAEGGIDATFVQDNHSLSTKGILRGIHAQRTQPQGKLVRAIEGSVLDIAVDIRPGSPTYKQWVGVELSADNFRQLYVPPGYGHGFVVLSESAQFEYKCTDFYNPKDEISIAWNDPDIGINWPISDPILSEKDANAPKLSEVEGDLIPYSEG